MDVKKHAEAMVSALEKDQMQALEHAASAAVSEIWFEKFEGGSVNRKVNEGAKEVVEMALRCMFFAGVEFASETIKLVKKEPKS